MVIRIIRVIHLKDNLKRIIREKKDNQEAEKIKQENEDLKDKRYQNMAGPSSIIIKGA